MPSSAGSAAGAALLVLGFAAQNVTLVYWTGASISAYGIQLFLCCAFSAAFAAALVAGAAAAAAAAAPPTAARRPAQTRVLPSP